MNKKTLIIPAFLMVASLGISAHVSAETLNGSIGVTANPPMIRINAHDGIAGSIRAENDNEDNNKGGDEVRTMMRGVFGTVTAVNGSTITISSKSMMKDAAAQTTTTYTVNTTSSTVVDKNRVLSSVAGISVGDTVMVEGTVSGTVITATRIHDGVMAKGSPANPPKDKTDDKGVIFPEGNGQPIIGGTVTAVSGNTVTITNKSNASYTIDVTNAKITKNGTQTAAVSNIAVGDTLLAQGTINGNAVTAVSVVDSAKVTSNGNNGLHLGFFGSIGSFFAKLFGFGK